MSFLLRVVVPDRPGSLGAIASAIGAAGGDIVGVDVVEHREDGRVVDDFLVELPHGRLPDSLVSACRSIAGVDVDFIGRYSPGATLHRDLEAVEAMTAEPDRVMEILIDLIPGIFRSGWALLLDGDGPALRIRRASGGAPEADGFDPPWLPLAEPVRIEADDDWAPESWHDVEAIAVPLRAGHGAVIFGRDGGPRILESEFARLVHLTALAEVIRRGSGPSRRSPQRKDRPDTGATQVSR